MIKNKIKEHLATGVGVVTGAVVGERLGSMLSSENADATDGELPDSAHAASSTEVPIPRLSPVYGTPQTELPEDVESCASRIENQADDEIEVVGFEHVTDQDDLFMDMSAAKGNEQDVSVIDANLEEGLQSIIANVADAEDTAHVQDHGIESSAVAHDDVMPDYVNDADVDAYLS